MEKNREEGYYWVKLDLSPLEEIWVICEWLEGYWQYAESIWNDNDMVIINETRILNPDEEKQSIVCRAVVGKPKGGGYCMCSGTCADHSELRPVDDGGPTIQEIKNQMRADWMKANPDLKMTITSTDEVTPTNTGEKAEPLEIWIRCQTCNGEGGRYTSKFGHLPCDACGGLGTIRKEIPAPLVNKEEVEDRTEKNRLSKQNGLPELFKVNKEEVREIPKELQFKFHKNAFSDEEYILCGNCWSRLMKNENTLNTVRSNWSRTEIEERKASLIGHIWSLSNVSVDEKRKRTVDVLREPSIKEGQWTMEEGADHSGWIFTGKWVQLKSTSCTKGYALRLLKQLNATETN